MSSPASTTTPTHKPFAPDPGVSSPPATRENSAGGELATHHSRTQIADTVVSKIAGLATREVSGVYALGGGAVRALGALRERIPGATSNASQGVTVEVGERQTAVDLDIVVEYGVSIADLAKAIRRNVITALERMTGLEVVEVNVMVNDVHIPGDDDGRDDSTPAQLQRVT